MNTLELKNKIIEKIRSDYISQTNLEVIYHMLGGDLLEGRRHKTDYKYSVLNLNGDYTIVFDSPIDLAVYVNNAKYTPITTMYVVQHEDGRAESVKEPKQGDTIISVMEGETKWSRNYTMK